MSKFNKGETVRSRWGTILKVLDTNWVDNTYLCSSTHNQEYPLWYGFDELTPVEAEKSKKCECGSAHDKSFPNHHSVWCPEFYDISEGKNK